MGWLFYFFIFFSSVKRSWEIGERVRSFLWLKIHALNCNYFQTGLDALLGGSRDCRVTSSVGSNKSFDVDFSSRTVPRSSR